MSNTVITNYTDLNGPSTKADSSVVVIVNKDGSLSVDQNLLGTLMGTDGSQAAGISVVRVGHEGKPEDATDSESDDDKVPHVTLSVDSYYDEPNSIIKYDSGAEMLQSLRIETRENSLIGFQNDHCYTPLTSPSQGHPQISDNFSGFDDPVIEITQTPPPKPVPQSKKITILEQQIIPKGKKLVINPPEASIILKGNDALSKPLPALTKAKHLSDVEKSSENTESSSISSGDSIPDRDSDSDYKDTKDRSGSLRLRKSKTKPRILKSSHSVKAAKLDLKVTPRSKSIKTFVRKDIKDKVIHSRHVVLERKTSDSDLHLLKDVRSTTSSNEISKITPKQAPKISKKEKKTPAHVTALLSDMSSLFSSPDVIRRVSTDGKAITPKYEQLPSAKKLQLTASRTSDASERKSDIQKADNPEKAKNVLQKSIKQKSNPAAEKVSKSYDLIPQLDDASLAQILQDTSSISSTSAKGQPNISTANIMNSPGLAGPLSPTLDLLGGLQPEEEGLSEDLLMHVAQLVESSENLQEVIDTQVLGKVDNAAVKTQIESPFHQHQQQVSSVYMQTPNKSVKTIVPRKDPIEIVRRDGRVITLPPIEAPATRSSKRKSQMETTTTADVVATPAPVISAPMALTPEPQVQHVSKQYSNKKLIAKKQEHPQPVVDKMSAESQESWNSEDDPNRLWCICKQPHNNRFMICCDGCEEWFHGKCVNITKAMGQQMEEQGIEWRCPNCIKKAKGSQKVMTPKPTTSKLHTPPQKSSDLLDVESSIPSTILSKDTLSKTNCIVCKKPARASSIYCSDACILKHAQDSLGNETPTKSQSELGKPQEKLKSESRVIVYERKSGRLLAGPNAPTAENLKTWLQKNPTFEVVRPGALSAIKPSAAKKKASNEPGRIQTTLNFERIPRKSEQSLLKTNMDSPRVQSEAKERVIKILHSPKEPMQAREMKATPQPKTPVSTRSHQSQYVDTPRPRTLSAKLTIEPKKPVRATATRSQSTYDKATVSPSTSRRKEAPDAKKKMDSTEPIRDNVRKALQEQMTTRMAENSSNEKKFTEEEIRKFANDTESELHELFRDVGMKYKAKYRSLMFNIKDRKNLSLWQKICDGTISPKQLVRLSPEELASQELAQWRDKEAKHQLELIKKSELDLLAASKTYVLKTHKGEEVMETKESVSTELDPNVPVEDVVVALNEAEVGEEVVNEILQEGNTKPEPETKQSNRKREREHSSRRSKKSSRESKRESERRKSRSSRRQSDGKEKEERSSRRRSHRKSTSGRLRSLSKQRTKKESSKEKSDSSERSRYRSRSRGKSRKRSKSREHSRSASKGRDRSQSRSRARRRSPARDQARSRSQDHAHTKQDSTDSDSVERPKSAMLKEAHPEYDPHEPMITSAFSEEDLRKSGGDSFEENYKTDIKDYDGDSAYDPGKPFTLDSNVILSPKFSDKSEKISEVESDQEPSSTVECSAVAVWNGCINMVDVARFYVAAHEVSGNAADLEEELTAELDIVGRINPDTVWDYIGKMKRNSTKDIVILKLQAANDEEKMQYIALYSYLSSRNRLGVVKASSMSSVKDFYIVPVPAHSTLPAVLLPAGPGLPDSGPGLPDSGPGLPDSGPGLPDNRTHLLIAVVVRHMRKRPAPHVHKDILPAKVARESRKRSYTPPIAAKSGMPMPATYTSPALSTSVKDKIAASLAAADDEEAYSPGSSSSGGSAPPAPPAPAAPAAPSALRNKMDELNRQIEEQKQQILKMAQADSSVPGAEDEAYSPSRPMTPPGVVPLANIALPSNLQEILATIKQRSEPPTDVDMRNAPLP